MFIFMWYFDYVMIVYIVWCSHWGKYLSLNMDQFIMLYLFFQLFAYSYQCGCILWMYSIVWVAGQYHFISDCCSVYHASSRLFLYTFDIPPPAGLLSWGLAWCSLAFPCVLALSDAPGLGYSFVLLSFMLKADICPRNPGSLCWTKVWETRSGQWVSSTCVKPLASGLVSGLGESTTSVISCETWSVYTIESVSSKTTT